MQNKKRWLLSCFVFGLLLALSVQAEPLVSNIVGAQRAGTKLVDITYDLTDADHASLAVTIRISKDAGATWDVPCTSVSGNGIGLEVTPGAGKSIVWDAGADWNRQWSDQMKVEVKATVIMYLVVDLSAGPEAASYPVSPLTEVPAGGWTDEYKTTKLVLRRIPAGTFLMGSPEDELGSRDDETQHQVTLTKDFYVGVFEVTQKQWERVMGNWRGYFYNADYRDARPVDSVSYIDIRGDNGTLNWPASNAVGTDSFIGRLRTKTNFTFDLPTEAQWQYACRASTITALNSGKNLTNVGICPNMSEVGRYWYNGGKEKTPNGNLSVGTAKVGSYLANAWGLYDMHGNIWEWCLDWYGLYSGTVTDPIGAVSGENRVLSGGSWINYADFCRSSIRRQSAPSYPANTIGFRMCLTAPFQ